MVTEVHFRKKESRDVSATGFSSDCWMFIQTQLDHNVWAIGQILSRCEKLTPEQYGQVFNIGPGSLQKTLAHMVEAMFFYADTFKGERYRRREGWKQNCNTPSGLRPYLAMADRDLRESMRSYLSTHRLDEPMSWMTAKKPVPVAVGVGQVFDHGSHHRAQCLNMLKQVGVLEDMEVYPLIWATGEAESG